MRRDHAKDYDLVLSKLVWDAWEDGELIDALIVGGRRWGKSGYALKVAHGFFMKMGYSWDEAWIKALGCLKFRIEDIIRVLDHYAGRFGERTPIIIADDATVHLNKYRYLTKTHEVSMLKGLMDVVGTCTAGWFMTCPNEAGLLKFLREYTRDRYKVEITKTDGHHGRLARGYQLYTLPSGLIRVSKKFEDHYSRYVPDQYYGKYAPMRETLAAEVIGEIKKAINLYGYHKPEKDVLVEAMGLK